MNDREVIEMNIELHRFGKEISFLGIQISRVEMQIKHLTEKVQFLNKIVVKQKMDEDTGEKIEDTI